ncbi:MAG: hypothetical protein SGCHY_003751 [Lobulomycetales sp.]
MGETKEQQQTPSLQKPQFATHFYGDGDKGWETVLGRLKSGKAVCEDVALLFRERAALEEEYGKRLARLSKSFSSRSEGGSLRESLEVVRLELEGSFALLIIYLLATAQTHLDLASDIRVKLDRPVSEFIANQAAVRKNHNANVERIQRSKHQLSVSVQKSREKCEARCAEVAMLEQAKQQNPIGSAGIKEQERLRIKLEKAQTTAHAADFDYQSGVEKLAELHSKWIQETGTAFSDCQKLEQERIDFLRTHTWTYANLLSSACVADDEGCERIRLSLEKCSIEDDIQLFIKTSSTGTEIPTPISYVNYRSGLDSASSAPAALSTANIPYPQQKATSNEHISRPDSAPIFPPSGKSRNQQNPQHHQHSPQQQGKTTYLPYDPYDVSVDDQVIFNVQILYDYNAQADEELTIKKGDVLGVLTQHDDGWWECKAPPQHATGRWKKGLIPSNFCTKTTIPL